MRVKITPGGTIENMGEKFRLSQPEEKSEHMNASSDAPDSCISRRRFLKGFGAALGTLERYRKHIYLLVENMDASDEERKEIPPEI